MPSSLTRLPARLSGTSLEIRYQTATGPAVIILEPASYLRLFDSPNTSGLLLGFAETEGEPSLHVYAARALAPSGSGQLVPAFQQFLQARQFNQTGSHADILGYFSSALCPDAMLSPEEERFVTHIAPRGVRFLVGRTSDGSSHSFWLRFVNSDYAYLVAWEPSPSPEPSLDSAPVPESLAMLSAATQLFAEPANLSISPAVAARNRRWTLPVLFAFGLLLAGGGYLFYRNHTAPPAAPVLTAATTAAAPPQPVETSAAPPVPVATAPVPVVAPASATTREPAKRSDSAPETPQAPKPQSRQLDLSRLKSSTAPASGAPTVEIPTPSTVPPETSAGPVLGLRSEALRGAPPPPPRQAPPVPTPSPTVAAPPEPTAPPSPMPIQIAFVPARLVRRTSISMAPSLVRTLPPNSQITVKVDLDERGHPIAVNPVSATPGVAQYVSNLVAQAVRRWEYQPAMRGGKPIPGSTNVQVNITRSDQ